MLISLSSNNSQQAGSLFPFLNYREGDLNFICAPVEVGPWTKQGLDSRVFSVHLEIQP